MVGPIAIPLMSADGSTKLNATQNTTVYSQPIEMPKGLKEFCFYYQLPTTPGLTTGALTVTYQIASERNGNYVAPTGNSAVVSSIGAAAGAAGAKEFSPAPAPWLRFAVANADAAIPCNNLDLWLFAR